MPRPRVLSRPLWLFFVIAGCGSSVDSSLVAPVELGSSHAALKADAVFYTLHPRNKPDLVLAAANAAYAADDAVHLAATTEEPHALWYRWNNEVRIFDDKCLRVKDGQEEDGTPLVVGECDDDAATQFDFTDDGLRWSSKGRCLAVADGHLEQGAAIVLAECQAGAAEQAIGVRAVAAPKSTKPKEATKPAATPASAPGKEPSRAKAPATPKPPSKSKGEQKPAPVSKGGQGQPAEAAPAKAAKPAEPKGGAAPAAKPAGTNKAGKDSGASVAKPAAAPTAAKGGADLGGHGAFGPSPAGTLVAPYFYDWGSPHGFAKTLLEVHSKGGVQAATIAFGLSGGGCKVAGFGDIGADIKAFRAQGGTVVLSFGGASGTYLQATCQDGSALAASILGEMKKYDTHLIDFDVEGSDKGVNRVTDPKSNNALMAALVEVGKQDPQASISFTLAADDGSGISGDGYKLLQLAASKGVRVARVNLMAMDYGHKPAAGKTAGDLAIACAEKAAAQMAKIWPKADSKDIYHAIGITPMIGQNDGNSDAPFLPSDADKVATYARSKGIGLLAYWAMQRDLAAKGDYNDHSNNQQSDYQYFKALSASQK